MPHAGSSSYKQPLTADTKSCFGTFFCRSSPHECNCWAATYPSRNIFNEVSKHRLQDMNITNALWNTASRTYFYDSQIWTLKSSRCNKLESHKPNLIKNNIHPLASTFTMSIFPTARFQEAVGNLKSSEADKLKHFKACQLLHCMIFKSHSPLRFQKCTYLGTEQEWQNMSTWTLPLPKQTD